MYMGPTGSEMLAVVPQLTMGTVAPASVPRTSHWRSPAPITTGIPAGRSRNLAASPVTVPITVSEGTTGGSRSPTSRVTSSTTVPSGP